MACAGHSDKHPMGFEVNFRNRFAALIRLAALALGWGMGIAALSPTLARAQDPAEILRTARVNNINQSIALEAKLRGKFGSLPLKIALAGGEVSYEFSDPAEKLILQFSEKDSSLRMVDAKGNESEPSPAARIRGSGLTYEDLSMQFLYWPMAKLIGEETLIMQSCYKIEVHPLRKGTAYGVMRLWIDKKSGAILQMEGFDGSGRLVKRFKVIEVQKVEDQWFLKTMRVESFVPDTGKISDRAYLEVTVPD